MEGFITVAIGSDHNGISLKELIIKRFNSEYRFIDVGPFNGIDKVDYVDYAERVTTIVSDQVAEFGILICGTGIGMSIAANRFSCIRASLVHNLFSARKTREHNNSNVLCLGSWVNDEETNIKITNSWLKEPFSGGRHIRRLKKLSVLPKSLKSSKVLVISYLNQEPNNLLSLVDLARALGDQIILALPPNSLNSRLNCFDLNCNVTIRGFSKEIFNEIVPDVTIIENRNLLEHNDIFIPRDIELVNVTFNLKNSKVEDR